MKSLFGTSLNLDEQVQRKVEDCLCKHSQYGRRWFSAGSMQFCVAEQEHKGGGIYYQDPQTGLVVILEGYAVYDAQVKSAKKPQLLSPQQACILFSRGDVAGVCSRLSGSFTIVVWHSFEQTLTLIRDQVGTKPLYYAERADEIVFSSMIRGIHRSGFVERTLNPMAVDYYIAMIAVPDPYTAYNSIHQIPAGSYLVWRKGQSSVHTYWSMFDRKIKEEDETQLAQELRAALSTAVGIATISDREVGSFLSGGHDTTVVVGLASHFQQKPLKTFTIGYGHQNCYQAYNEFEYAQIVAKKFGTEHFERNWDATLVKSVLPQIVWHMDSPSGDALNSYLVSKFTAQEVEVALTGTGGDEIFIGTQWFLDLLRRQSLVRMWSLIPPAIKKLGLNTTRKLSSGSRLFHYMSRLEALCSDQNSLYSDLRLVHTKSERTSLYTAQFRKELLQGLSPAELIERMAQSVADKDILTQIIHLFVWHEVGNTQLRDLYVMGSANRLDCRSPLVDKLVLEAVASIPNRLLFKNNQLRAMMITACEDLLPRSTIERKKKSFIAPLSLWLKDDLYQPIQQLISRKAISERGIFNPDKIEALKRDFYQKRFASNPFKIWNLALLELWFRINLGPHDYDDPPQVTIQEML